jgi:hypothetical protein
MGTHAIGERDGARGEPRDPAQKALRITAFLYLAGYGIHGADHLARGMDKTPPAVAFAGLLGFIGGIFAIALLVRRHRLSAPLAVAVGFVTAVAVTAIHVPPHWGALSEPFRGGVNALDWLSVASSVVTAFAFGCAGLYALLSERSNKATTGVPAVGRTRG